MMAMQCTLRERFERFLRSTCGLNGGARVVLAVSGGMDSMAMLHLFVRIRKKWNFSLAVAHVNHGLRGEESEADERFVSEAAAAADIPFYVTRTHTADFARAQKLNLQDAARRLRYAFLDEVRRQLQADGVATAHHADDNAETVLLNILRGCGIHGLAGIAPHRVDGSIIRPLLFASRREIEEYVQAENIRFRTDRSNESLAYMRNLLRHRILPALREADPHVVRTLERMATTLRPLAERLSDEAKNLANRLCREDAQGVLLVDFHRLLQQPRYLQEEIMLQVLQRLGVEPAAEKIFRVLALSEAQTGRTLALSGKWTVYRNREFLVLQPRQEETAFEFPVVVGRTYVQPTFEFSSMALPYAPSLSQGRSETEYVDAGKLGSTLLLRTWRPGDWFIPLGMKGKKKLSDFFTDMKVARHEKVQTPVLESDGSIVWVCGLRLDDRFKLTPATTDTLQLRFLRHTHPPLA